MCLITYVCVCVRSVVCVCWSVFACVCVCVCVCVVHVDTRLRLPLRDLLRGPVCWAKMLHFLKPWKYAVWPPPEALQHAPKACPVKNYGLKCWGWAVGSDSWDVPLNIRLWSAPPSTDSFDKQCQMKYITKLSHSDLRRKDPGKRAYILIAGHYLYFIRGKKAQTVHYLLPDCKLHLSLPRGSKLRPLPQTPRT